jgi:hypothetical protein
MEELRVAALREGGRLHVLRPDDVVAPAVGGEPVDRHAWYAILATDDDTPLSWLRAGEALSATLLTATMLRLATSPMSDVVEVPASRRMLRDLLGGVGYPMIALRVGVPADGPPPPAAAVRSAHEIMNTA